MIVTRWGAHTGATDTMIVPMDTTASVTCFCSHDQLRGSLGSSDGWGARIMSLYLSAPLLRLVPGKLPPIPSSKATVPGTGLDERASNMPSPILKFRWNK